MREQLHFILFIIIIIIYNSTYTTPEDNSCQ